MRHPSDRHLQAYLDGELTPSVAGGVQVHLDKCPGCLEKAEELRRLSLAIRGTRPDLGEFAPEGEFWSRLAGRCRARPTTWPLVPYLPPFLLSSFGLVANVGLSLVLTMSLLTRMGVVPSFGPTMATMLPSVVKMPLFQVTLFSWLPVSAEEVGQVVGHWWTAAGELLGESLVFWPVVLILGVLLVVVLLLNMWWVLCWTRPARLDRNGGK